MAWQSWRPVAVVVAGVVLALGGTGPVTAAPADPEGLAVALRWQARLTAALGTGDPPARTDAYGYPGGAQVTAGDGFSCSAGAEATWCWGAGDAGQLGDGSTDNSSVPTTPRLADEDLPVGAMAAGRAHTCALSWFDETDEGGRLLCWGENADGQVGDATTSSRTEPVAVAEGVQQVTAGAEHTCAITVDDTVACWGRNDRGQLGTGSAGASVSTPQPVPGLTDVVDIAAGGDTTCALDGDGGVWCWGSDSSGQLGDGGGAAPGPVSSPVAVVSASDDRFVAIAVGRRHACAVTGERDVWCWGDDSAGQLGNGAAAGEQSGPVAVELDVDDRVWSIGAGGDSSCVVLGAGRAYCWGANDQGQLGVGDRVGRDVPAAVDQRNVLASFWPFESDGDVGMLQPVSVGPAQACALDALYNTYCWGDNDDGQVGDGSTDDALIPVPTALVPGTATAVSVTSGDGRLGVTWRPPDDLGVGDPLGYLAFATAAEDQEWVRSCKASSPGCTIEDLTNGVDHTVRVMTVTSGGSSISASVPGLPVARASASPVPPGGGGALPITGASLSLLIAAGGVLVGAGMLCVRLFQRRMS